MFDAEQKGHIYNAYLAGYVNSSSMGTDSGPESIADLSVSERAAYAHGLNDGRLTGEHHTGVEPRSSGDLIAVVTAAMQGLE